MHGHLIRIVYFLRLAKGLKMHLGQDMKYMGQLFDMHRIIRVIMHGKMVFNPKKERMTYVSS